MTGPKLWPQITRITGLPGRHLHASATQWTVTWTYHAMVVFGLPEIGSEGITYNTHEIGQL